MSSFLILQSSSLKKKSQLWRRQGQTRFCSKGWPQTRKHVNRGTWWKLGRLFSFVLAYRDILPILTRVSFKAKALRFLLNYLFVNDFVLWNKKTRSIINLRVSKDDLVGGWTIQVSVWLLLLVWPAPWTLFLLWASAGDTVRKWTLIHGLLWQQFQLENLFEWR